MRDYKDLAVQALSKASFFSEFSEKEIRSFLRITVAEAFPVGTPIVTQGETGDCMFIILEGQVRVLHRRDGQAFEIAVLEPGEFFGELSLIDAGPRTADVIPTTDTIVLKVTIGALDSLGIFNAAISYKFMNAVSRVVVGRVREINVQFVDTLLSLGHHALTPKK